MSISEVLAGTRRWWVEQGDCREMLAALPDKSVQHVITDPPYDSNTHKNARNGFRGRSEIHFAPLSSFEFVPELLRVASRWAIAFCASEQLGSYAEAAGLAWIRSGFWHRPDGCPQFTGDRPGQPGESFAVMHTPGKKRWNGGGRHGFYSFGVERTDRAHPTQKPTDLMLAIMADFTDPDDIICDPFAGSGTTGVACLRLGRRFIGCEMDPKYHAIAVERLTAESQGSTLAASRAGQVPLFGGVK